jgi:hypothetical protein
VKGRKESTQLAFLGSAGLDHSTPKEVLSRMCILLLSNSSGGDKNRKMQIKVMKETVGK